MIDGIGGVDIQTAHGIGSHQQGGVGSYFAAYQNLLNITAGHTAHRSTQTGSHYLQLFHYLFRHAFGGLTVGKYGMTIAIGTKHHVIGYAHAAHKAHAQTVFRHECAANAHFLYIHGVAACKLHCLVAVHGGIHHAAAGLNYLQARYGLQQFLLAGAGYTGNAQYFAAVCSEGYLIQLFYPIRIQHGKVLYNKALTYVFRIRPVNIEGYRTAHHHIGKLLRIGIAGGNVAYILTLAQYCYTVRYLHNLMELMGDYDNGLTICLHVAHNVEEHIGLLRRKHGGGFVQYQYIRSSVQHLDYFKGLFFGY